MASPRSPAPGRPLPARAVAAARLGLVLALGLAAAACTLGPDYKRPPVDVAPRWHQAPSPGTVDTATAWWKSFGDAALDGLVREALAQNQDLRIAITRIEQYEARLQVAQAAKYPQVIGEGSRQRITLSQERPVPLPANVAPTNNQYEAAYAASWEIDLWGRVRRSNEAALAELLAVKENREAVVLSLVAEVVGGYLNLLQLDRQLALMKERVANREQVWKLLESKAAGGAIAGLQVATARAVYEEARAELPLKEIEIAQAEHQLSFLAGRNPGPIQRGRGFEALTVPGIPAGLPSDLLQQRPDIRRAEQDLVAANARIGVAKAAWFPTLSLTGGAGYASTELRNFGQLNSNFWYFGPQIAATLFDGGRIAGNVREAEAKQRELVLAYQRAIQSAFREVDDALAKHRLLGDRLAAQQRQIAATEEAAAMARRRVEGGYANYQEVLEMEALVLQAQITQTNSRGNQLEALIALFRTLGGGWTAQAESLAASGGPAR